jgi:hypothetical protein
MSIIPLMNIFGQERDRQPVVSGSFYPSSVKGSEVKLSGYFASFGKPDPAVRVRAIIVPHAGYVYSGHTSGGRLCCHSCRGPGMITSSSSV